jgi:hypothetical protein
MKIKSPKYHRTPTKAHASKTAKKAKLTGNGRGPDGPIGHWTQLINRARPALLSERGVRCYFVVKNHGPDDVLLVAEHGDHFDLPAGAVRATFAQGIIRVEDKGEKSAFIEFEFLPLQSK